MTPSDVLSESLTRTTPEPAPLSLENAKDIRVSLGELAEGVKTGDTVAFTVASIDPTQKEAILLPIKDASELPHDTSLDDVLPPAPGGKGANDTSVLLGPMDKLKSYLVKKSQNTSKPEAP